MTEQYANSASTKLSAPVGAGDTTIFVSGTTGFPSSGPFRIVIDQEIMTVTAVAGGVWTVTRASEVCAGVQQASSHVSGSVVTHVLTVGSLFNLGYLCATRNAAGDGVTDDTAVIQAAINSAPAGSIITFQPGTYLITGLTSNIQNAWFLVGGATLKLAPNSSTYMMKLTASGQAVSGGVWDGNKGAGQVTVGGNGFYDHAAVNILADDCRVEGAASLNSAGIGFKSSNAQRPCFRNCRASLPELHGVYVEATTVDVVGVDVDGCYVDVSGATLSNGGGISITSLPSAGFWSRHYRVRGCNILGVAAATPPPSGNVLIFTRATDGAVVGNTTTGGRMGLSLDSNQRSSVAGNTFLNPSECCIEVPGNATTTQQSQDNTVAGNVGIGGTYGVESTGSLLNTTYAGNTFKNASSIGIYIDGSGTTVAGTTITGNLITGAPTPISLRYCENAAVSGNTIAGTDPTFANGKSVLDLQGTASGITFTGNACRDCQYGLSFFASVSTQATGVLLANNRLDVANPFFLAGSGAWGPNCRSFANIRSSSNPWFDYLDLQASVFSQRDNSYTDPNGNLTGGIGSTYTSTATGRSFVNQDGSNTGWTPTGYGKIHNFTSSVGTPSLTIVGSDDQIDVDATAANAMVNIPSATLHRSRMVTVVKVDASGNTVAVAAAAGAVQGTATLTTQWQVGRWRSDGTNWIPC